MAVAVTAAAVVEAPLATVVTAQLWRMGRGRMELAELWMGMGAIVSTPRLVLKRAATLATVVTVSPRSMKEGGAKGVMVALVTAAAKLTLLASMKLIKSKREKT